MGEAKRRAQASAGEHRRLAARIDERIKQLDALGMQDVEILAAMEVHLADFHHLIMRTSSAEMDALCVEFAGFYRFAKIMETLAFGIASGNITVPGGRVVNEEHWLAAAIDQRVRQLEATGIHGAALLEHMVGHVLDLQRIWSTVSDESLAFLCRQYPGLYRYGMLMEEAVEAENKKTTTAYSHLPQLPDAAKAVVAQLLTNGAALERGLHTVLEAYGQLGLWAEIDILDRQRDQWRAQLAGLPGQLQAADVPKESVDMLLCIFEPMAQRIHRLHDQVVKRILPV